VADNGLDPAARSHDSFPVVQFDVRLRSFSMTPDRGDRREPGRNTRACWTWRQRRVPVERRIETGRDEERPEFAELRVGGAPPRKARPGDERRDRLFRRRPESRHEAVAARCSPLSEVNVAARHPPTYQAWVTISGRRPFTQSDGTRRDRCAQRFAQVFPVKATRTSPCCRTQTSLNSPSTVSSPAVAPSPASVPFEDASGPSCGSKPSPWPAPAAPAAW